MKLDDEISVSAPINAVGHFVQIAIKTHPRRFVYLTRREALALAEQIKRKAERLPLLKSEDL
jgi:hypothetical protein